VDSVALLATRNSADIGAAVRSLPQFEVVAICNDHSLLQMSEDWFALLGPDADDGAGQWAILEYPHLGDWVVTFETFGAGTLLTHFHRV
jgi:hypothetical protein